jgi:tetratricopeptide (TPR) repeat protein
MKAKGYIPLILVSLGLLVETSTLSQAPSSASVEARSLMDRGLYVEALARAEAALTPDSADAGLWLCKVDALLGLHRNMEARQVALAKAALSPALRFKAGVCALEFGRVQEALDHWNPLYADKDWAESSYRESVLALAAVGNEAEARALLAEALQKVPGSPVSLLHLCFFLDPSLAGGTAAAEKLKVADTANAARYDVLLRMYAAAGGDLYQETLEKKLPAEIVVKEKTERQETTALSWSESNTQVPVSTPGAASEANFSSGTQNYMPTYTDTSAAEGGKTGTLSAPPRAVVGAKINGQREELMVLDSSRRLTLVSSRVAKKLNLQRLGPGAYRGVGLQASVPSEWVLLKEVRVGPVTFANVPALVIDEKTEHWKETGGVLPLWLFRRYGLHYDRRHGKLELVPSGTPPAQVLGPGSFQAKVLWFDGRPFIETRIQDKPGCYMALQTATVGTYLEQRRLADLGVSLKTSRYGSQRERGLFGLFSSGVADNVTIYLGTTRINLPTVLVADLHPDAGVDCWGIVGRNLLDLFDVYVDYPANVLAFRGYEKGR